MYYQIDKMWKCATFLQLCNCYIRNIEWVFRFQRPIMHLIQNWQPCSCAIILSARDVYCTLYMKDNYYKAQRLILCKTIFSCAEETNRASENPYHLF